VAKGKTRHLSPQAIFNSYAEQVHLAVTNNETPADFPEKNILALLDNTWRDTAKAVFNNWLGKVYQITNQDRRLPFMQEVDPRNPLNL